MSNLIFNSENFNRRQLLVKLPVIIGALALLSLIVFRDVIATNVVLFMTDNNIGMTAGIKEGFPSAFLSGAWSGGPLLGMDGTAQICVRNLVLCKLVPCLHAELGFNWIFFILFQPRVSCFTGSDRNDGSLLGRFRYDSHLFRA